jgi:hypothetical protein
MDDIEKAELKERVYTTVNSMENRLETIKELCVKLEDETSQLERGISEIHTLDRSFDFFFHNLDLTCCRVFGIQRRYKVLHDLQARLAFRVSLLGSDWNQRELLKERKINQDLRTKLAELQGKEVR